MRRLSRNAKLCSEAPRDEGEEPSEAPTVEKQAEEAKGELKRLPTKAELLRIEAERLPHLPNHMPKNPIVLRVKDPKCKEPIRLIARGSPRRHMSLSVRNLLSELQTICYQR